MDGEGKALLDACFAGDRHARERFQSSFLPLIYRFEGGGREHESATHNFIEFLFEGDRLFRRLRGYRGDAPLGAYLWAYVLPDLMKQFRAIIRRQRFDTVSLDGAPPLRSEAEDGAARGLQADVATLLARLAIDKRVLIKLLYIEDFELEAAEIQFLADRNGCVRTALARLAEARETVRSREAVQKARIEGAESAGQWIRLYERRLLQLEHDMRELEPRSPQFARCRQEHADLTRKLAKRQRQRAANLAAGQHTVVTPPTALIADLLGQNESTTRAQITRVRRELTALLSQPTVA